MKLVIRLHVHVCQILWPRQIDVQANQVPLAKYIDHNTCIFHVSGNRGAGQKFLTSHKAVLMKVFVKHPPKVTSRSSHILFIMPKKKKERDNPQIYRDSSWDTKSIPIRLGSLFATVSVSSQLSLTHTRALQSKSALWQFCNTVVLVMPHNCDFEAVYVLLIQTMFPHYRVPLHVHVRPCTEHQTPRHPH